MDFENFKIWILKILKFGFRKFWLKKVKVPEEEEEEEAEEADLEFENLEI